MGDMTCREHTTPNINLGAKTVRELINWKNEKIYEPVFTCKMTIKELESIKEKPLQIPSFSVHTQSVERVVRGFKGFI